MHGAAGARAEFDQALREDDAVLLYEEAPCGYFSTTPEGLIAKTNRTFARMTGYQADRLVGRVFFDELLTAGGRIYFETIMLPTLLMQDAAREIALDLVCADGSHLPVLLNSVLGRDADGRPRVVRTVVFDASARRNYERELLRAKQRAEALEARSSELVRTLQQTLIPPAAPTVAGLDVAALYRPAGDGQEVGGDFYDLFQVTRDDWVAVVGDVSGKGVSAAVVTALARHALRGACVPDPSPSAALAVLNRTLLHHESQKHCTVVIVHLHRAVVGSWTARISSGGHPLPLLLHDGRVDCVGEPGVLLGILPEVVQPTVAAELGAGDAVVLYTDGITEGRAGPVFYGLERLRDSVRRHRGPAQEIAAGVLADALGFQGGRPADDIALVVLRVPEPPRSST